jgi:hypothetical protein
MVPVQRHAPAAIYPRDRPFRSQSVPTELPSTQLPHLKADYWAVSIKAHTYLVLPGSVVGSFHRLGQIPWL